jgi:hypothetical protein
MARIFLFAFNTLENAGKLIYFIISVKYGFYFVKRMDFNRNIYK